MTVSPAIAPRRTAGVSVGRPARDPRVPDGSLPRMDVAGLVGLATRGPIDVPVLVGDPEEFAEVFGPPLVLGRDVATGRPITAQLPVAVSAFFSAGGRACWVVRVTLRNRAFPYSTRAHRAEFDLTGVVRLSSGAASGPVPARLIARSAGSWADQLRAGVRVLRRAVRVEEPKVVRAAGGALTVTCRLLAGSLAVHDLVEIEQGEGRLQFAVTGVEGGRVSGDRGYQLTATTGPAAAERTGHVLTLELRCGAVDARPVMLTGLGCVPGHPRYVADLRTDEELAREALATLDTGELPASRRAAVFDPGRFPLAAPADLRGQVLYPLPGPAAEPVGPVDRPGGPGADGQPVPVGDLDRDGLGGFSTAMFLDPRLAGSGARDLSGHVEFVRDQLELPLLGLHSLMALDDVTLVAVPDATQRPWTDPTADPEPAAANDQTFRPVRACGHHDATGLHDLPPPLLPAPVLTRVPGGPQLDLSWSPTPNATYVLEETERVWTWTGAREVYRGTDARTTLYGRGPGRRRYRVRVEEGASASDWSAGLTVSVPVPRTWTTVKPDLVSLGHLGAAVLAACAARGDWFAVLDPPHDASPAERNELRTQLRLAAGNDERTLSHGTLLGPWLPRAGGDLVAPSGWVAGLLAARALGVGCWREPAAEPPISTLSDDPDLRRIGTRRLLSLVRRLVLRQAPQFVFEPLSAGLRRTIRRELEAVLAYLLVRGAFAGPGPGGSYQVVVNPAEGDRLITEIKLAPAGTLRWLSVVLATIGDRVTVAESSGSDQAGR